MQGRVQVTVSRSDQLGILRQEFLDHLYFVVLGSPKDSFSGILISRIFSLLLFILITLIWKPKPAVAFPKTLLSFITITFTTTSQQLSLP